ncbi:hypothetical protein BGZ73_002365 [Actinomortierella ambigua]|nr:hypothetical protein BGZ73_002365 [Actinomortierella ambigua]
MAIHEVLDSPSAGASQGNNEDYPPHGHSSYPPHPSSYPDSPPYKRKGSPDESLSDPPSYSRSRPRGDLRHHHSSDHYQHPYNNNTGSNSSSSNNSHPASHHSSSHHMPSSHHHHHPRAVSPRHRQESPMPLSNSEEDEDEYRNYKKRRMAASSSSSSAAHPPSSSAAAGGLEVMDQVRQTLSVKQQQKAIIESRQQQGQHGPSKSVSGPTTTAGASSSAPAQSGSNGNSSASGAQSNGKDGATNPPVTEKKASGISVFHGSASFAALNRRPLSSPKNPKNAKSLTIFAPSYSESSLTIHSAPLQPSHPHPAFGGGMGMGMNPLTSHGHHPYFPRSHPPSTLAQQQAQAVQQAQQAAAQQQGLHSPRTIGHVKKSSRIAPRTAGLSTNSESSGTLPAPILSSHTGPLPSPSFFPHPSTPFHPVGSSKQALIETVSNLFDQVDSSKSLKYTLEEQIRKSAQLLQTLQSSGSMIETLVRGQFKELEKGVIDRFETEIEHLVARVKQLEDHAGLTPPPRKVRTPTKASSSSSSNPSAQTSSTANNTPPSTTNATSGGNAQGGASGASSPSSVSKMMVESPGGSLPSPPANGSSASSSLSVNDGTLPTPPLAKSQGGGMDMDMDDPPAVAAEDKPIKTESTSPLKQLDQRIAALEQRQEQ